MMSPYRHVCPTYDCYCFNDNNIDCVDMDLDSVPFVLRNNLANYYLTHLIRSS